MNYVNSFNLLGFEARQRPCLTGSGEPTTTTVGAVGELYLDVNTGKIFKCTSIVNDTYIWVSINDDSLAIKNVVNNNTTVRCEDISPIRHELKVSLSSDTVTDFSTINVSQYGKNLFDISSVTGYYDINSNPRPTDKWSISEDGTLFCKHGYYSSLYMIDSNISYLPKGKYTFSCDEYVDLDSTDIHTTAMSIVIIDNNGNPKTLVRKTISCEVKSRTWTKIYATFVLDRDYEVKGLQLQGNGSASNYSNLNMYFKNIQFETGDKPTEYEKFNGCSVISANTDGAVNGVTSIYPTTTFLSNIGDININVEYNLDMKKYIENLYQEVYINRTADTVEWIQGSLYNGSLDPSHSNVITSDYIRAPVGEWSIKSDYTLRITKYNSNKAYLSNTGEYTTITSFTMDEDGFVRIGVKKADNEILTPEEGNSSLVRFNIISSKTDEIQDDLNMLRADVEPIIQDRISQIPDYWRTHLDEKIPVIQTNSENCALNGDSFIFFTDYHIESSSGKSHFLMKEIIDNTTIKKVVFGGDIFNGATTHQGALEKIRTFSKRFSNFEMYGIRGNHEYNFIDGGSVAEKLEESQIYNSIIKRVEDKIIKMPNNLCYYQDNINQKIRYIFMDAHYLSATSNTISEEELQWLKDRMTELETSWSIVVFSHQGIHDYAPNGEAIVEAMVQAKNDENMKASIIALIYGHDHIDMYQTDNGFLTIGVTCDTKQEDSNSGYNQTPGTINEHAFDVFSIDTVNKTIKTTRIGRGVDRSWNYEQLSEITSD